MPKKKTEKKTTKSSTKKTEKKTIKKYKPKKMKRIDESNPDEHIKLDPNDKVKTEIIISDGVVIVNPIYNPFDENNKD